MCRNRVFRLTAMGRKRPFTGNRSRPEAGNQWESVMTAPLRARPCLYGDERNITLTTRLNW